MLADGPPAKVLATYHRLLADAGSSAEVAGGVRPGDTADPRVWGDRRGRSWPRRLVGPDGPTDRFIAATR